MANAVEPVASIPQFGIPNNIQYPLMSREGLGSDLLGQTRRGIPLGITLILEYEIPKWDGISDVRIFYVPVSAATARRKAQALLSVLGTQH